MTHKMLSRSTGSFSQMSTELITNSRQTRFHTLQQLRVASRSLLCALLNLINPLFRSPTEESDTIGKMCEGSRRVPATP